MCSRRQTGSGLGVLGPCSQGSAYAVQRGLIPEQGKPEVSMSQGVHAQQAAAQEPPVVVSERWALRTGASRAPRHFQTQGELTLDSRCGAEAKTGGCSFRSLLNVIHPSPHKPLASGARGWEHRVAKMNKALAIQLSECLPCAKPRQAEIPGLTCDSKGSRPGPDPEKELYRSGLCPVLKGHVRREARTQQDTPQAGPRGHTSSYSPL